MKLGFVRVGGVAHHEVDARLGERASAPKSVVHAVDGRLVQLEVARVQHVAGRALEEHAHRARDGVVHGEELDREAAELHLVARLDLDELGVLDAVLGELALDEAERELRAVDGHRAVEILQRYGSVPVWSSWPCVMTMPRSLSAFSST